MNPSDGDSLAFSAVLNRGGAGNKFAAQVVRFSSLLSLPERSGTARRGAWNEAWVGMAKGFRRFVLVPGADELKDRSFRMKSLSTWGQSFCLGDRLYRGSCYRARVFCDACMLINARDG